MSAAPFLNRVMCGQSVSNPCNEARSCMTTPTRTIRYKRITDGLLDLIKNNTTATDFNYLEINLGVADTGFVILGSLQFLKDNCRLPTLVVSESIDSYRYRNRPRLQLF